jgi:ABC-type glycerol-3-phosphate transport system permease component
MRKPNQLSKPAEIIVYILLILAAFIALVPFIWLIASTFKNNYEIVGVPATFFPKKITFDHYLYIIGKFKIFTYFFNSLFLAVIKTSAGVYSSVYIGYIFAKFEFHFKNPIYYIIVFLLF